MKISSYISLFIIGLTFMSCEEKAKSASPTGFSNLFFEDKFDSDSLSSDWTLVKYTSDKIEIVNHTQNTTFAQFGHKIGIAVGNENNEITLDKVPKGGAWYTMKIENFNKTITLIVSVKDGIEMGRVSLNYTGNIDGYWGISGAFLENKLTDRSMVYFDNFKIMQ